MKRRFFCLSGLASLLPFGMFGKKNLKPSSIEWISVKDRLPDGKFPEIVVPDNHGWVVYSRSIVVLLEDVCGSSVSRYFDILTLRKYCKSGDVCWEDVGNHDTFSADCSEREWGSVGGNCEVIYWAELPDWEGEVV